MEVTGFDDGEIMTELLRLLTDITHKNGPCKQSAEQLIITIQELRLLIHKIKYSGVELDVMCQSQFSGLMNALAESIDLFHQVKASSLIKNFQLAKKMDNIKKEFEAFKQGLSKGHMLANVHHVHSEIVEQIDALKVSTRGIERQDTETTISGGGWEAKRMREKAPAAEWERSYGGKKFGAAIEIGKRKVREMLAVETKGLRVFGINGIGGSGKTTLAREVCRDDQVLSYFENRIIFQTISESTNIDSLRESIGKCLVEIYGSWTYDHVPEWNLWNMKEKRTLVVLDDVWSQSVLEQLIFPMPGCKTLVVSRFKFPEVVQHSYEVELLKEHEAMSLFCCSAFGQKSIPPAANEYLVKQIVNECKGLPLALEVIGASLRKQPEIYWVSPKKWLSRGEMISETRASKLMERMAISVRYLEGKIRECFLDLGVFPEGTKIPLDVLINIWVEIRDLSEEEAFAVLVELSNKNLINLVKKPRAGEMYSSYLEVSVSQHVVLRDLVLHLNNQEQVTECKRLIMPRRESELPEEWELYSDWPFNAEIVSVHTGEMNEMEWPRMEFPKAEVLILNFSSNSYFLPPFIENMPKLRALIVINHSISDAILCNFAILNNLTELRSLWLEKVRVPPLSETIFPPNNIRKLSLVLCKVNNSLDPSVDNLSQIFPCLSELTIDRCNDLLELPSSICRVHTLKSLSIINCHSLQKLPANLHNLLSLEILRICACPNLKMLPREISELSLLKYLDVSQCIYLTNLPEGMGKLAKLEKIDMRECGQIRCIPKSVKSMQSLRSVICDDKVSWVWKDVVKVMTISSSGRVEEAVMGSMREEAGGFRGEIFGAALEVGKRKVREMMEVEKDDLRVFGIFGIGGSGKTTLATELCKDDQVKSYFENRIIFLTVSQSPNIDSLRTSIWGCLMGDGGFSMYDQVPNWNLQYDWNIRERRTLVVLDDVWSQSELEQLIFPVRGCKTLVVSRFKFPEVVKLSYEIELLKEHEAMSLFCYSAFGQKSIPPAASEDLVKQIVNECKGLPLALKVAGASLRDQPEMYWASAKTRLSKGETICESHGSKLMGRMAASVGYLEGKVKECFLDLGAFPEDKKIPLDILINMWAVIRDIDEEEAFTILIELSNKNLINLVKHPRARDNYSSYFEVSVTVHDVLRDLALHLNNQDKANERKRLLMPKRESVLPRDWERNADRPFNAQIVSVHTGKMNKMDWPTMEFPKAEVLILNFSSCSYFLPPFIENMPRLRALIVINRSTSNAVLRNFSVFNNLTNLRSLWLENVCVPPLSETTIPLENMTKISLVLCKVNNSLDPSMVDLPKIFPCLSEFTIDYCDDLVELPSSICRVHTLKSLNVTNCHRLQKLPADLHKLLSLEILRIYACPSLGMLPQEICELSMLKYLDISQCISLMGLPDGMGKLNRLEKIDMRECLQIRCVPKSAKSMQSLRSVICEEEVSWVWKNVVEAVPRLHVEVAERCFDLNWLDE